MILLIELTIEGTASVYTDGDSSIIPVLIKLKESADGQLYPSEVYSKETGERLF